MPNSAFLRCVANVGFVNVYNKIDDMEGDKVDDPGSANHGKRMKNGWTNSGSPWTYDVNPELIGLPRQEMICSLATVDNCRATLLQGTHLDQEKKKEGASHPSP